jgi:hypothetical protein
MPFAETGPVKLYYESHGRSDSPALPLLGRPDGRRRDRGARRGRGAARARVRDLPRGHGHAGAGAAASQPRPGSGARRDDARGFARGPRRRAGAGVLLALRSNGARGGRWGPRSLTRTPRRPAAATRRASPRTSRSACASRRTQARAATRLRRSPYTARLAGSVRSPRPRWSSTARKTPSCHRSMLASSRTRSRAPSSGCGSPEPAISTSPTSPPPTTRSRASCGATRASDRGYRSLPRRFGVRPRWPAAPVSRSPAATG